MPVIEGYDLEELVGEGGMGRVYATSHPADRPLVVKVLRDSLASDPIAVARLVDEARAAGRVSHDNVVRVVDHGRNASGTPFLVMERVEGISLGDIVEREGALPLSRIRAISSQILAGLDAIHRAGLVHGDIKSDNVLVDENGHATIIDFGLARDAATRPSGLDEHMLSGTPEYMAPELARGEPLTPVAELYAVGVIIYEMLTGSTPFGGGSVTSIFERHLCDEVVPPSARAPDRTIPPSLEAIVMRTLSKDPAARHHDAAFLATAVERAIPASSEKRAIDAGRGPARAPRARATRRQTERRTDLANPLHKLLVWPS